MVSSSNSRSKGKVETEECLCLWWNPEPWLNTESPIQQQTWIDDIFGVTQMHSLIRRQLAEIMQVTLVLLFNLEFFFHCWRAFFSMRTLYYQHKHWQDRIRYRREQFSASLSSVTPQMSLDVYLLYNVLMSKQWFGKVA